MRYWGVAWRLGLVLGVGVVGLTGGLLAGWMGVGGAGELSAGEESWVAKVRVVHSGRVVGRVAEAEGTRVVPLTRGENAYLGEFSLRPGAQVPVRAREAEEYLYVLEGSAILVVDQQSYLLGPGMGVFLPAGSKVGWNNGPDAFMAVQVFAGPGPSAEYEGWSVEDTGRGHPVYRRQRPRWNGRLTEVTPESGRAELPECRRDPGRC